MKGDTLAEDIQRIFQLQEENCTWRERDRGCKIGFSVRRAGKTNRSTKIEVIFDEGRDNRFTSTSLAKAVREARREYEGRKVRELQGSIERRKEDAKELRQLVKENLPEEEA